MCVYIRCTYVSIPTSHDTPKHIFEKLFVIETIKDGSYTYVYGEQKIQQVNTEILFRERIFSK